MKSSVRTGAGTAREFATYLLRFYSIHRPIIILKIKHLNTSKVVITLVSNCLYTLHMLNFPMNEKLAQYTRL